MPTGSPFAVERWSKPPGGIQKCSADKLAAECWFPMANQSQREPVFWWTPGALKTVGLKWSGTLWLSALLTLRLSAERVLLSVPRVTKHHLTFGQVPFEGPNIHRLVQKILMGTVHEAQIFFVYQQFQASCSCERRVWRLFSPDSWCLLKPTVNLNSLLFCKITDSPFLVSHTFLCFANQKWVSLVFLFVSKVSWTLPNPEASSDPRGWRIDLGPGFWNRSLQKWLVSNSCDLPTTRWWFQRWIQNLPQNIEKTGTQGHAPTG